MGIFDFLKNKPKLTDEKSDTQTLPNKDELKAHLESIQKEIYKFLKPLGFKKKGRTFNRKTEDGIYQVINIQSGRYEFGDKYVIPGFRENYYGKFTINLGVMVQEIYKLDSYNKTKDIYQDYDCQIRTRLSHLTINQDFWWVISKDTEITAQEIVQRLKSHGIQWLDTFETREKIIENWGNMADSNSPRAKLDVALIVLQIDPKKGRYLMQDYYDKIEILNVHKVYVKSLAERLGLDLINR